LSLALPNKLILLVLLEILRVRKPEKLLYDSQMIFFLIFSSIRFYYEHLKVMLKNGDIVT